MTPTRPANTSDDFARMVEAYKQELLRTHPVLKAETLPAAKTEAPPAPKPALFAATLPAPKPALFAATPPAPKPALYAAAPPAPKPAPAAATLSAPKLMPTAAPSAPKPVPAAAAPPADHGAEDTAVRAPVAAPDAAHPNVPVPDASLLTPRPYWPRQKPFTPAVAADDHDAAPSARGPAVPKPAVAVAPAAAAPAAAAPPGQDSTKSDLPVENLSAPFLPVSPYQPLADALASVLRFEPSSDEMPPSVPPAGSGGLGRPFTRAQPPVAPGALQPSCAAPQPSPDAAARVSATTELTSSRRMTDALGVPVVSDSHTLSVGADGPAVLADAHFLQKLAHFDRERIPERVVHAKGAGAFGVFTAYGGVEDLTMASVFAERGKSTPVFVRFSTVIGSRGSADTARDPRGFAVKFYTDQGNWDIVGNNMPVFFIRDAIQFPDIVHSLKPDPVTGLPVPERFWDFFSMTPAATHMVVWLYSDYGTLPSFRFMNGFGVNTFTLVNALGVTRFCKFHWLSKQGIRTLSRDEAQALAGTSPNIATEDLHCAIASGDLPSWELNVQVMDPAAADTLPYDPLDDTKVWDEADFPLIPLGLMTLDRNPENFYAQTEQSAFCPANVVPGIGFSADKMLTGRVFSYSDTQRYRLGANFTQLPVNRPASIPANYQQDGKMAFEYNIGSVNYHPNSLASNFPLPDAPLNLPGLPAGGELVREPISRIDDFTQAGLQYRSYTPAQQAALASNIAVELKTCRPDIVRRALGYLEAADPSLAAAIAEML